MRIETKFKIFALWLIIFSFFLVSVAWGKTDIKKAIIGKWERYDEKLGGMEFIEFFEDGTVFSYHAGWRLSAGGDYRFIDRNRIRIKLGGLWGLVGPIVYSVSVTKNELILTMPDGKVEKYQRVSTPVLTPPPGKKPQPKSEADKEVAEIKEQIKKRLKMLSTTAYTYLLDTDSVRGTISTTWMYLTSPIRGNLVERYNELYYAALDYHGMALSALRKARLSLTENNIPTAQKYIREADRYIRLANLSNDAATRIFRGEVESAAKLAEGIYKGSKASVKYGATMVLGPWGSKVVDGLFLTTDFAIDTSTKGLDEAAKDAIRKAIVTVIFNEIKIKSLGNKTISDVLTKGTTKVIGDSRLYPILDDIIKNPELKKAIMSAFAKSAAHGTVELSKRGVEEFVRAFEDSLKEIALPRGGEIVRKVKAAQPQITSNLRVIPQKDKYQVGDVLTAEFIITNKGNAPITFDVLTVGGRLDGICPEDRCPDFTWKEGVTLRPGEVYPYKGKLKLKDPGNYHFFITYRTKDGWNTVIPTTQGVKNTKEIKVEASNLQTSISPFPDQPTEKTDFDIFGTYRCQSSGQFLELRKDNTYFIGHSGKWKMDTNLYEIVCFPASREEAFQALQPCSASVIGTRLWLTDRIDSDSFREWLINRQGEIIAGRPNFVRQKGAKLVKKSQAMLWSNYVDRKGDFLEFKEDGTYIRTLEVGRWERRSHIFGKQERQGNILILKEKGEKDPTTFRDFKIEGNTLRSNGTFFVKLP